MTIHARENIDGIRNTFDGINDLNLNPDMHKAFLNIREETTDEVWALL